MSRLRISNGRAFLLTSGQRLGGPRHLQTFADVERRTRDDRLAVSALGDVLASKDKSLAELKRLLSHSTAGDLLELARVDALARDGDFVPRHALRGAVATNAGRAARSCTASHRGDLDRDGPAAGQSCFADSGCRSRRAAQRRDFDEGRSAVVRPAASRSRWNSLKASTCQRKCRIAIIGAGAVSDYHHVPGIRLDPRAELVAACDPNEELLAKGSVSGGRSAPPRPTSRSRPIREVDAVIIATPNDTHRPIALAAHRRAASM